MVWSDGDALSTCLHRPVVALSLLLGTMRAGPDGMQGQKGTHGLCNLIRLRLPFSVAVPVQRNDVPHHGMLAACSRRGLAGLP